MDFMTVGIIVGAVVVLLSSLSMFVAKNYVRIPPNKAAVVFGRKHTTKTADGGKEEKGYRLVQGGGVFRIPFLEEIHFMDLSNRQINIKVDNAPNQDGVMTTVEGIANVKFASTTELLSVAVERFLGKSNEEVNKIIFQNLEGHMRSTVGKMTMEELIRDKAKLNESILSDANEDFEKMGIKIDFLNIADIRDNDGYIEALGKTKTAQVKRDAEIGEAEAQKETVIKTTTAQREGVEKENENQEAIFQSNRKRDVVAAKAKAETDKAQQEAAQAGPLANAEALKAVVEAQAATEAAQEKANILVEEQRAKKMEKQLYATTIVPAEAAKQAKIVEAEGIKQSTILAAEGNRESTIKEAEGAAEAVRLKAVAEADGEAAQIKKTGEAEAEAIKLKLLAEAEGVEAKALAYEKLDATGKFLEVLNALQTLGPNLVREFAGVMAASTQHFKDVDEIKIVDFGGQGNGGTTLGNFGKTGIEMLTKFVESAKGTGVDVDSLLSMAGIKAEDIKHAPTVEMKTTADTTDTTTETGPDEIGPTSSGGAA